MAVFTLLPMTMSFLAERNYPANTLQGKVICTLDGSTFENVFRFM
jgi:hypothetical protein